MSEPLKFLFPSLILPHLPSSLWLAVLYFKIYLPQRERKSFQDTNDSWYGNAAVALAIVLPYDDTCKPLNCYLLCVTARSTLVLTEGPEPLGDPVLAEKRRHGALPSAEGTED